MQSYRDHLPNPELTHDDIRRMRLLDAHMFQAKVKCDDAVIVPDKPKKSNGFYRYRCTSCGAKFTIL